MQPGNISLKRNTSTFFRWNLKRDSHAQTPVRATGTYSRLATDSPLLKDSAPHEIATICFVKFNRKPAPATIKLVLASGPKPSTTERRHPRYAEIGDGKERRRLECKIDCRRFRREPNNRP